MENAGGYKSAEPATAPTPPVEEEQHQSSCFALEEEKGNCWRGSGSTMTPSRACDDIAPMSAYGPKQT
jgi:hypothetical protein